MIGFLTGEIVFSDGNEIILTTNSGVGYQIYYSQVLAEGSVISLFISHVVRENAEELYGFQSLRGKKLFEMLTTVKNVGSKSAFALTSHLGVETIIEAVMGEDKAVLKQAPGVGDKAAGQMILDLSKKIAKVRMYSAKKRKAYRPRTEEVGVPADMALSEPETADEEESHDPNEAPLQEGASEIIQEAVLACKELGFKEEAIVSKAQRILSENAIQRPEQLVHLVLKEL